MSFAFKCLSSNNVKPPLFRDDSLGKNYRDKCLRYSPLLT